MGGVPFSSKEGRPPPPSTVALGIDNRGSLGHDPVRAGGAPPRSLPAPPHLKGAKATCQVPPSTATGGKTIEGPADPGCSGGAPAGGAR